MTCDGAVPDGISRLWVTADGQHLDVRGMDPPQPMVEILSLIDRGEAENVVTVHLDREPIFLYPELDDRGWSYEIVTSECGNSSCEHDVRLRIVRLVA